nr:hypothetical protein [Tanacetum cinerariifolium]
MFWGYDCRLWGVVWSSGNDGKTRREGLQVMAGKTVQFYLAGSQSMLKSSYKVEDGVIISIPPLVGGVADVVAR